MTNDTAAPPSCTEVHDALLWVLWETLEARHGDALAGWDLVRMPVAERIAVVLRIVEGWSATRVARALAGRDDTPGPHVDGGALA